MAHEFLLAHGKFDTLINRPGETYDGLTFGMLLERVKAPTAAEKTEADFMIPSTYRAHDGRSHDAQRERGVFKLLCVDVDTGSPSKPDLIEAIHDVCGRVAVIAYTSASASKAEMKWRAIIPIKQAIKGAEYEEYQAALFDLLAKRGITCDGALARCGQPVFLPNVPPSKRVGEVAEGKPAFYDHIIIRERTFDLEGSKIEVEVHSRRAQEQAAALAAEHERLERERQRSQRRVVGEVDPIIEFNERHTIADLLARYGYERRGTSNHYRSPHQTTASFATRDYRTHWVSLSSTDAAMGIGRPKSLAQGSYTWGDAFDLFVFYEHQGDQKAAVRAYAAELRGASLLPEPPDSYLDDFDTYEDGPQEAAEATQEAVPAEAYDAGPEPHEAIPDPPQSLPEAEEAWPTLLTTFDEAAMPRREWIYGFDYIRKFVSVLASAGGIGKTSLTVVEALAIVTGRPLLNTQVKEQTNVWIVNLEDPVSEIQMRTLAAMKHYGIKPADVRGRLFVDGEDTITMTLAAETRDGVKLNDALLAYITRKIIEHQIGVVIIDPFVSVHMVNENSNSSVQAVVATLRKVARDANCSVALVHHVRKGNGDDAGIESVRGAGSLIGAARAARVINRVSEDEALKLGVEETSARSIFRVDDGKANLAPPAHAAVYRRMISVEIDNGEKIGVCVPFAMPDIFDGISAADARKFQDIVDEAHQSGKPFRESTQSPEWIGNRIASFFDIDLTDKGGKGRVLSIIRTWKTNDVIRIEKQVDGRRQREVPVFVAGERIRYDEV
jgi:hypothetical protein